MTTPPRVTVFIPAYNSERFIGDAVASVLRQSYRNLSLLVIDDGSTDGTRQIVEAFASRDSRIRLVSRENRGRPATRNQGLEMATGDYLALLDADDVCLPDRLAAQVDFLDTHPEVAALGTAIREFGSGHRVVLYPENHDDVGCLLCFDSGLANPSAMLRLDTVRQHGIRYDPGDLLAQDYRFWTRLGRTARLANLSAVHLRYRRHPNQGSEANLETSCRNANAIAINYLAGLGVPLNEGDAAYLRYEANVKAGLLPYRRDTLERAGETLLATARELVRKECFQARTVARTFLPRLVNSAFPITAWSAAWLAACTWRLFREFPAADGLDATRHAFTNTLRRSYLQARSSTPSTRPHDR